MSTEIFIAAPSVGSNGVETHFHQVATAKLSDDLQHFVCEVHSWPSSLQAAEGMPPATRIIHRIPIASLASSASVVEDLKSALVGLNGFDAGAVVPVNTANLEMAKARKKAFLKARRDYLERSSTFMFAGNEYLSDPLRISGATTAALIAQVNSQVFELTWTLANDTPVVLNGSDMLNLGLAQLAHVDALHEHARVKFAEVDAATTISEVEAIEW